MDKRDSKYGLQRAETEPSKRSLKRGYVVLNVLGLLFFAYCLFDSLAAQPANYIKISSLLSGAVICLFSLAVCFTKKFEEKLGDVAFRMCPPPAALALLIYKMTALFNGGARVSTALLLVSTTAVLVSFLALWVVILFSPVDYVSKAAVHWVYGVGFGVVLVVTALVLILFA